MQSIHYEQVLIFSVHMLVKLSQFLLPENFPFLCSLHKYSNCPHLYIYIKMSSFFFFLWVISVLLGLILGYVKVSNLTRFTENWVINLLAKLFRISGGLSCWNRAVDRSFGSLTGSLAKPFPTCHAEWTQDCSLTWLFYGGLTVWWHSVFFPKNRCSNCTSHLFKWPSQVTLLLLQSQSNHIQRSACS